jgi:hydrogenase-4 component F
LVLFGLVSVIVAAPFILAQRDLKRLLGYSSVEHVGIIALALGFGGYLGTYAALLHVLNHGVTKALAFFAAGDAIARYGTRDMQDIRGLIGVAPWIGALLLAGALGLSGTPPFSVFISELLVVRAGIAGGHALAVAVMLVMLIVIFAGLLHHAGGMVLGVAGHGVAREGARISPRLAMALVLAAGLLLGLCIPSSLDRTLARAVEIILG